MRLINVETLKLETFVGDKIPPYAILSHTWGPDKEEVSFDDIETRNIEKPGDGTMKLKGCCNQAKEDNLGYAWIDTCCIDKRLPFAMSIFQMFLLGIILGILDPNSTAAVGSGEDGPCRSFWPPRRYVSTTKNGPL
jgi:Heterokaryon incompatibility protein (HET)